MWKGLLHYCCGHASIHRVQHQRSLGPKSIPIVRLVRRKAYEYRTDKAVLATSGFHADGSNLVKLLKQRIEVNKPSQKES